MRDPVPDCTAMGNEYGLVGLTRDEREDREDSRRRCALSSPLKELIEALALQKPPLSIAALHRQIARIAKERSINFPVNK
jgi:hypothetical protein